ncbi:DUF6069 family protein [Paractinoplanes globisporus]|uniref:DUF6069 family protein n=1 Tax=Paractinoplanes globisporus TaxID=113565 RepID=A0ABW6WRG4_9ACTN|nr:DUF6069 family protein [Actinoplanes globisporus]
MSNVYRPPTPPQPVLNAGRLWAGGAATALVAALIAIVGILFGRGVFDVAVLAPKGKGAWGDASTFWYAAGAAAAALVATGLIHVLIITTPRPMRFFGWVIGLATVAAMLLPFTTDEPRDSRWYTAGLNLVLGIAIGSLVAGVAKSSLRPPIMQSGVGLPPVPPPPIPPQYR